MGNAIFYFTGTGNSLAVAKKIAMELGDTKILNIREDQTELNASGYERVGFVFPVYYYLLPLLVESFIKKMTFSPDQYIFAIATYGGTRGLALQSLREIIKEIGGSLKGEFSVLMPSNYIVEYGALPDAVNNIILSRSEKVISRISSVIKGKQTTKPLGPRAFEKIYLSRNGSMERITNIRNGFKTMDSGFSVKESCNGCRTCEKICPARNIKIVNGHPEWTHKCEQCMACIQWCNKKSISYLGKTEKKDSIIIMI